MGFFRQRLSQIEARLQSLIEGNVSRLFPNHQGVTDLATRLVSAMHAGLRQDDLGQMLAPNLYLLHVNPKDAIFYQDNPLLITEFTQSLRDAGVDAGIKFSGTLVLRIVPDPAQDEGAIQVLAKHSQDELMQTAAIAVEQMESLEALPEEAFLIVDGTQVFALHHLVVNIGRRSDNDLVIEDNRISRLHAQIRWVRGQYVIFDLESTGGTWVNGERESQRALRPGDVISLAGVPLVFGVENAMDDYTQDLSVDSAEGD